MNVNLNSTRIKCIKVPQTTTGNIFTLNKIYSVKSNYKLDLYPYDIQILIFDDLGIGVSFKSFSMLGKCFEHQDSIDFNFEEYLLENGFKITSKGSQNCDYLIYTGRSDNVQFSILNYKNNPDTFSYLHHDYPKSKYRADLLIEADKILMNLKK